MIELENDSLRDNYAKHKKELAQLRQASREMVEALDGYLVCRTPRSALVNKLERLRSELMKE